MAMLAEPKRKTKWILNPRGKLWCNDDSKIGQKLLEKMGWSKGKGLGRDEQGDLEPIRLKYKNDSEGVGFEVKNDQWIAHGEEFNNILDALNGTNSPLNETDTTSAQSLESRSKNTKSRVHYHKFTRGKDLSRYSAEDMACILGKRTTGDADQETKDVEVKEEPTKENTNGSVEKFHGVSTIQRGCLQEYFASKMAAAKEKQRKSLDGKQEDSGHEGSSNSDEGGKDERRVRINEDLNVVKEFRSKEKILKAEKMNPKNDDAVTNETIEDISPKKKKKGSKTKVEEESADVPSKSLPVTEEMQDNFEIKKKKKKKSEKEIPEPVVEPVKTKKSKIGEMTTSTVEIVVNGEGDHTQEEPKKKKKKAKKQEAIECEKMINKSEEDQTQEEAKKKKKKAKKQEEETIECEQIIHKGVEDQTQEEPTKKKKKSKKEEEAVEISKVEVIEPVQKKSKKNKTVEVSVEQVQNEEDVQPPVKKKKKSKKDEQEAPEKYTKLDDSSVGSAQAVQITAGENQQNGLEQGVEQETKKKKKSKRTEEVAPETKTENSLEKTETKRNKKNKNISSDEIEIESMKQSKGIAVEAPKVQGKTSEDAQVTPAKEKKGKKRKACDMTDEVAINGKEDVGCLRLGDEKLQERKNVDQKVCSADQLARQADVKPDDKKVGQTRKKNISAILFKAGAAYDRRTLESMTLDDGSKISQSLNRKLLRAKLDKFKGSNILTIAGYGYGSVGAQLI